MTYSSLRHILVIRPGGIGDAVLLISSIRAIKFAYPECVIDVLAEKRNASVFQLISDIRSIYLYDSFSGLSAILQNRYDVVIDTEQWYRLSAVVARLVRAPMKIGFDTNARRRMLTHGIRYNQSEYEQENFLALLRPLNVDSIRDVVSDQLELPVQSVSKVRKLLQPLGANSFVVIFSGASIPEKRWGTERFRVVAKRLVDDGYRVVIVGSRNDRVGGEIIANAGGLNLAGLTSLTETAAVIARSRLVISGDSGVLHLAVVLNIPTLSLFGPSSVDKWAPKGEKHVVLNRRLSCSPCSFFGTTPKCPFGVRCMNEISVEQVVDAAVHLLQRQVNVSEPEDSAKRAIQR